jgi:hypothetical protein
MVTSLAVGVVAAAFAAGGPTPASAELARLPASQKVQALAIAGSTVFVATAQSDRSIRLLMLRRGSRRTIGAFGAPIPAAGRVGYELDRVAQTVRLEASGAQLAVLRTVRAFWRPDCLRRGCRRSGFSERLLTELYAARPGGSFRRLIRVDHGADRCSLRPTHVEVAGSMLAYVARFGEASGCARGGSIVAVVESRGDALVHRRIFIEKRGEITALALAGSYVVWATRHSAPCPCTAAVLADWRRGRTLFRFVAPELNAVEDVAVTAGAAVALVGRVPRRGCNARAIVLLPAHAVPRRLGARATSIGGFVGPRLVHAGLARGSCTRAPRRIELTTTGGATRVIRTLGATPSGLDFDGTYIVYAVPLRAGSTRSPQVVYRHRVR